MAVEPLERREDSKEKPPPDERPASPSPPPPPMRRRDRDSRERRDNAETVDRAVRREYNDRSGNLGREREYNKRRASPGSPPPSVYRDRRNYSPPPRRSPPGQGYKRMRRDEGYDGRRGSPPGRGGYGGGDRRFGYNQHLNGNDREMGGRSGYPDERPHGRHGGRSSGGYESGPSGWGSGRGGYTGAANTGRSQREGLMSYKQFIQELEDDILPAEAERRYQEYKSEYITTQKRAYFNAHKHEEWLKDKYHPTNLLAVIDRRNEHARKIAKDFLLELQSGTVDIGPGIDASASKAGQTADTNSENEVDVGGKMKRHERGLTKETDFPKAHPVSSEPRRVIIDIEQAQALVRKLDLEKGVEDNILCRTDNERTSRDKSHGSSSGPVIIIRGSSSVKGLEGIELLDTLVTYLWRIHGVDYYGLIETSEPKGLRHVRADGKNSDAIGNGDEWEKKLDSFWKERLNGQDPLEVMTAKEKIDTAAGESLDPYVRKIRDEKYGWKYGCGAKGCTKLFHAAEFVHKHLKLKHPELLLEVTSKVREDLFFQNYMGDENAPGGIPVMQPTVLKEKPQKRRLGPESYMKDERGRRERDNRTNGSERYDRGDNPHSVDFQANNDAQAGSNLDESMFDGFNGQGMPVSSFPSDMAPPPVLMPVPGAGPLGPFVPAPPEIAMQMMREQGGPSPFEGGGRNGRPGSHLGGPAPIIALPPQFRQDPRRLRSYDDLDAPEDEVTVIDYRSL
ncbi:hypothetical protein DCAR_0102177 [Daucus carota subsp. sativus]|uniref:C2H2-type domain-containing protein n=1 Tax=Daucus carota subsp. sativus TaxID=79200 RepID=A0AAF0W621_DAUCS|nr:PREDICTED: serrate RNA effector molecule-like [Daucus carota subsp. sativus]WOG83004.1 hypothetical protein DCAR_0102177 [Daucus carota subsp. sativus]